MTNSSSNLTASIVAIGQNAWGKGKTVTEAVKNCKTNISGRGKHKVLVYRVVGFNYVDDVDGSINYDSLGSCEKIDEQTFTRQR